MAVTCYATPGKAKASRICDLFAMGVVAAGGQAKVVYEPPAQLHDGAAVFYGVTPETAHLWQQCKAEGRDWYYIDNSYFDRTRGTYYRITRNAVQHHGMGNSDGGRLRALGITIQPPRNSGSHIVVCLQSPQFMDTVAGLSQGAWLDSIRPLIDLYALPTRVRGWSGNKKTQSATLAADLKDAARLITWSSSAAVEALIAGVPVNVGPQSAAAMLWNCASRLAWAEVLADNQWSLDEIKRGSAWGDLCKRAG